MEWVIGGVIVGVILLIGLARRSDQKFEEEITKRLDKIEEDLLKRR